MPDNRQSSKQRRAARNRAAREALAARRENALAARSRSDDAATFSSAGAGTDPADGGTEPAGAGAGPAGRGMAARYRGRRPGDTAVLVALVLSIVSAVSVLFVRVPVDDRGEPLPGRFRALYEQAREMQIGRDIGDDTTSLFEAQPSVLFILALAVLVCAFAVWANRRPDRSRLLTFAMLALAGTVILGAGFLFLPSLIALAVASFQVRKAEMAGRAPAQGDARGRGGPGGAGARSTAGGGADGGARDVIDVDSEESTPGAGGDDEGGFPPGR
ncbi:MAG: hypothetical protein ACLFXM_08915 [Acidimicrobiia bacterium]